jgi:hypothetical protein
MDVVTAVELSNNWFIFQAILGTPPQHPIIRKALEYSKDFVQGHFRVKKGHWMGPSVVGQALRDFYNVSDFDSAIRNDLLCRGVFLFKELEVKNVPPERHKDNYCSVGFADGNGTVYGYSRVKQLDVDGIHPCFTGDSLERFGNRSASAG